eukprot:g1605.t1
MKLNAILDIHTLEVQLNEIELLQSMYAGDGEFQIDEGLLQVAKASLRAASATKYFPSIRYMLNIPICDTIVKIRVIYPSDYPNVRPQLSISCDAFDQSVVVSIREKLCNIGGCGDESMVETLQTLERLVEEECNKKTETKQNKKNVDKEIEVALVHVDHMNDSKNYTAKLRKWCALLSLDMIMFYVCKKKRFENIKLLVQGDEADISQFLKRLRTEYVDVNASGKKCKERKSKVQFRRRYKTLLFEGIQTKEYKNEKELDIFFRELRIN